MGRLTDRLVLITGASRGIGAAVAKRFAAEGAQLILVARTTGGLEGVDDAIRATGGHPATLVPLDLHSFDAIDELAGVLHQRFGRIDAVVGNAAVLGTLGPVAYTETRVWADVFAVNVLANQRLLHAFDPLLRQSASGRAIFTTSGISRVNRAYWGAYAASKAALEAMVLMYAAEMARSSVRVNLVDPGVVRTRLREQAYPGEARDSLPAPEAVTEPFVLLAEAGCSRHGDILNAADFPTAAAGPA